MTTDPIQADEFVSDTLGDLLYADAETRETLATYLREQCSTTRTAERLFTPPTWGPSGTACGPVGGLDCGGWAGSS
ncbi:PucR family transcriptional regulator, partial [Streptomyces phyllanthi]